MEITKVVKPFIKRGWPNTFGNIVYIHSYKYIIVYVPVRVFYMYISEMVIFIVLNLVYPIVPFTP